jgi:M3 family oligoendopeptidase
MGDSDAEKAESDHRQQVVPVAEGAEAQLVAALLGSQHSAAVATRFGGQLLNVLRVAEPTLSPTNSEQRVQLGDLAQQYDKLVAGGEVQVLGETLTLSKARSRMASDDGELRRASFEAYWGWFLENREELASIFHQQVQLRDAMGKRLGHENFVPLGYAGMQRTDYGPKESAMFRESVLKHVSPLFARLCKQQATSLDEETLRPWDAGYHPEFSLPMTVAEPVDGQLDKMGRVLDRLSPKLATHFNRMRKESLIDLENRKGKAAGAYCTSFSDEGRAAIFCNSTGGAADVSTLCHEMGHAFQAWESMWIEAVDLRWPTSDAAEIHSMGMEYLCLPFLDEFFSEEQRDVFTRSRWLKGITLCCYVCTIDAFQHWVYEHPAATPDERDDEFSRLRDAFMPGMDWSGPAARFTATRWYAQLHLFRYPFYYIDYAIAETSAMQLAMLDAEDHGACLEKYLDLCHRGGSESLLGLLDSAGLRSPFGGDLMEQLTTHAAQKLGL